MRAHRKPSCNKNTNQSNLATKTQTCENGRTENPLATSKQSNTQTDEGGHIENPLATKTQPNEGGPLKTLLQQKHRPVNADAPKTLWPRANTQTNRQMTAEPPPKTLLQYEHKPVKPGTENHLGTNEQTDKGTDESGRTHTQSL